MPERDDDMKGVHKFNMTNNEYVNIATNEPDSKGEIVYDVKHKLAWWDYFVYSCVFPFACFLTYGAAIYPVINFASIFFVLIGLFCSLLVLYDIVYTRKNRFYITTQGVGFERRRWFKMQEGFFKFGEVGVLCANGYRKLLLAQPATLILFPLQTKVLNRWGWYAVKNSIQHKIVVLSYETSILSPIIYDETTKQFFLKEFIIKQTQAAIKHQHIELKLFERKGGFVIFGEAKNG